MTVLTKAKKGTGSVYPEHAIDGVDLERVEPLITAAQMRSRYFKGFPLVSPLNREEFTNKDLKDYIKRAASMFELQAQIEVKPIIRRHRLAFDPNLYREHIFLEVPNKPIQKVISLKITSASYSLNDAGKYPGGNQIYEIPIEWVDMGNAVRGYLNVNPINPAFAAPVFTQAAAGAGASIMNLIGQAGWVPGFWQVECLHGVCNEQGNVPVWANEAVGAMAAMLLIEDLIPLFRVQNQSLSADGLSQSISNNAPQLLSEKHEKLKERYEAVVKRCKVLYGNRMISSNV